VGQGHLVDEDLAGEDEALLRGWDARPVTDRSFEGRNGVIADEAESFGPSS
jgi:hypothetical protein